MLEEGGINKPVGIQLHLSVNRKWISSILLVENELLQVLLLEPSSIAPLQDEMRETRSCHEEA